ncbi:MAG TPA: hypothetical protein VFK32_09100 [Tepidiformaceae bacterium]|nr:hypothetical protein [Tepidiformaceae bacterium]
MTETQSHDGGPRGAQALVEALQLQHRAQERTAEPTSRRRGKRRKGDIIDLDNRQVIRSRRRRIFMVLLVVEAIVAVIAVGVLVAYLVLEGDTLQ